MSSRSLEHALLTSAGFAAFLLLAAATGSRVLRVCSDPNNLPFSNRQQQGFENRLALLVGRELGARVQYTWWPERRGFIRNTLDAGACDLVMGVPSSYHRVLPTKPYYSASFVFVSRRDRSLDIRSFDDPTLRQLRIGVQIIPGDGAETPASYALGRRGLSQNLVGYVVTGNYAEPNPPARVVDAVARGEVDVAVVWGPVAGYFASREPVPLRVNPARDTLAGPGVPLAFSIAMGVRRGDTRFRDELNAIVDRRRMEITRLLASYGVVRRPE
jgi:mxaJ protein